MLQPAATTGVWVVDWLWGLSLIVASMLIHAAGLAAIGMALVKIYPGPAAYPLMRFSGAIAVAGLLLATLHGCEASLWAATLVWLGAVANFTSAIYFSLQMATTLGGDSVQLGQHWKLIGPLEAISGMLTFGLSTALLIAVMQRVWPFPRAE